MRENARACSCARFLQNALNGAETLMQNEFETILTHFYFLRARFLT